MAAQFVTHDEYNKGQDALFARMTRYMDARFEALTIQARADKAEIDARFEALEADVATLKEDVAVLKADVATLKVDVAGMKTDVATLKADVATLKADVATLKADVATLKADVAGMKTDVAGMKTDVSSVVASQQVIMETIHALAADIIKQMGDGFAIVSERINENTTALSQRIDRLEQGRGS